MIIAEVKLMTITAKFFNYFILSFNMAFGLPRMVNSLL